MVCVISNSDADSRRGLGFGKRHKPGYQQYNLRTGSRIVGIYHQHKYTISMDNKRFMNDAQHLTPQRIVAELDKYIIGQGEAKRNVAIALRNRWRRMQVPGDMRTEIVPNNILMIGATGVGKPK